MKKALAFGILFCFLFSMTAQAKDVWEMAQSPKYGEKLGGMLGRGLLNVVTCFVDIPVQTVNGAKQKKGGSEIVGAIGGFATGALCTVLRAGSGVVDVAGSWVPGFNGIPVSKKYDNCLMTSEPTTYAAPTTTVYQPSASSSAVVPSESRLKYVKK